MLPVLLNFMDSFFYRKGENLRSAVTKISINLEENCLIQMKSVKFYSTLPLYDDRLGQNRQQIEPIYSR